MSEQNNDVHSEDSSTSTEATEQTETQSDEASQSEDQSSKTVPYSRFKAVNDRLKELEGNKDLTKPTDEKPDIEATVKTLSESQAKADFREDNELSKAQVDWLWQVSGGKPNAEMLKDTAIKAGLKAIQAENNVEANTPASKGGTPTYNGKTWNEIANDPKVSDADKQKAYENLTNSKAGKR